MRLAEDRTASAAVRERPIGLTDRTLRSDSLIGSDRSHDKFCEAEAMRGRIRPLTAKNRPLTASHGLSRPPMHSLTVFPVI